MKFVLVLTVLLPLALSKNIRESPTERTLRTLSNLLTSVSKRTLSRRGNAIDDHVGCQTLVSAWTSVLKAIQGSQYAPMIQQMENQIMTMHGVQVDFAGDSSNIVDEAFCEFGKVSSLEELARFLHMPVNQLKAHYQQGVTQIKQMISTWEDALNSPYVAGKDREVLQEIINFFKAFETVGLFDLN